MNTNILSVDDNHDVREITALFLRDSGYNVTEASSGSAALGLLDANPTIELLIADFAMPGMSGTELLERIRFSRPEISALFITGYADLPQLGGQVINEIVLKNPFTMEQLALAVRTALGQSD
jgi:CheY-like chemotaxis protein